MQLLPHTASKTGLKDLKMCSFPKDLLLTFYPRDTSIVITLSFSTTGIFMASTIKKIKALRLYDFLESRKGIKKVVKKVSLLINVKVRKTIFSVAFCTNV